MYYLNNDPQIEEVFFGGGAGPGKTFVGCYWQIRRRLKHPKTFGAICRNTLKDLRDTTLITFFDILHDIFECREGEHYKFDQQKMRIEFKNGSLIFFKEIKYNPRDPNFADLGSLELTDAFIDEASEVTKKARDILFSRIRKNLIGGVPKILLCSNPDDNWIKYEFVIDEETLQKKVLKDYQRFIPALLTDHVDETFRRIYGRNLDRLPAYDRARLLEGVWDAQPNENPFFYEYKPEMIKEVEIFTDAPLLISFDFNFDPGTATIMQHVDCDFDKKYFGLYTHDCVQQKGGTSHVCDLLIDEQWVDHPGGFFVTGDRTGNKNTSNANQSDWEIVFRKLKITKYMAKYTQGANERHVYSRNVGNYLLKNYPCYFSPAAAKVTSDLKNAIPTTDGKLYKNREQGHAQDAGDTWRYGVHAEFPKGIRSIDQLLRKCKPQI